MRASLRLVGSGSIRLLLGAGFLVAATAAFPGCVPKPKQDYNVEQIKTLQSLDEIMRVQAQTMDPQFNHIGQAKLSDAEFEGLAAAANKLTASSEALRSQHSQGRPPSFATFAGKLGEQAAELLAAAQAKDAGRASTALTAMRDTCRACHKEHR